MESNMDNNMLSIADIVYRIKSHILLIILCSVIFSIGFGILTYKLYTPMYQSNIKLFIGKELTEDNSQYNNGDIALYEGLMGTYIDILSTEDVIQRAIGKENLSNISVKSVLDSMSIIEKEDTQILEISYTCINPELAAQILTAVTNEFISTAEELIPNGKIEIINSAKIPKNPTQYPNKLNILIGFIFGMMIGIVISLFLEAISTTVSTEEDIERCTGITVIGSVPEYNNRILAKENKRVRGKTNALSR